MNDFLLRVKLTHDTNASLLVVSWKRNSVQHDKIDSHNKIIRVIGHHREMIVGLAVLGNELIGLTYIWLNTTSTKLVEVTLHGHMSNSKLVEDLN